MSRGYVRVTLELTSAWEVWGMSIDEDDIPEGGMTPQWVADNLHLFEYEHLKDAGNECQSVLVEEVEIKEDPKAGETFPYECSGCGLRFAFEPSLHEHELGCIIILADKENDE